MRQMVIIGLLLCAMVCGVGAEEIITDFDIIYYPDPSDPYGMIPQSWVAPNDIEAITVVVVGAGGFGAPSDHKHNPLATGGRGGGAGEITTAHYNDIIPGENASLTLTMGGLGVFLFRGAPVLAYPGTPATGVGGSPDKNGLPGEDGYGILDYPYAATSGDTPTSGGTGGAGGMGWGGGGGGGGFSTHPDDPDYTPGGVGGSSVIGIKYHYPVKPAPTLQWSPETGYYTGYWFNRDAGFINVEGLFSAILLPFTALIGQWFFMIVWGTLVMGIYLHSQDTTLPFVVGILLGAVISLSAGADGVTVMYLTMAFAGGGVLAKVLLGRL